VPKIIVSNLIKNTNINAAENYGQYTLYAPTEKYETKNLSMEKMDGLLVST
jgi:hypothetical protein